MSGNDCKWLPPAVEAMLDCERERQGMPEDLKAPVLARIQASLQLLPPLSGPGEAGPASGGGSAPSAPSTPSVSAAGKTAVAKALLAHPMAGALVLALAGTAGVAGYASLARHPSPVDDTSPSAVSPAAPSSTAPLKRPAETGSRPTMAEPPEPGVSPKPVPAQKPRRTTPRPAKLRATPARSAPQAEAGALPVPEASAEPKPEPAVSLAAERELLERARAALARPDAASASKALEEHAHRFPQGQLAEEREVLWIKALAISQRRQEARAKAALFRERFPRSILLPVVDAALSSEE